MADTIIRNINLNARTPEANIASVDTWINDTACKLNFLLNQSVQKEYVDKEDNSSGSQQQTVTWDDIVGAPDIKSEEEINSMIESKINAITRAEGVSV